MADDRSPIHLPGGVAAGIAAWTLGYLVTYLATVEDLRADWRTDVLAFLTDEATDWKLVGWVFYNAHAVDVQVPGFLGGSPSSANYVAADDGSLWLLALLPPALLLVAGFAVARVRRAGFETVADAAVAGATVCLGYVVLAVVGVVAFGVTVDAGVIRPDPIPAVLLAGVVYPLVFGAMGGVLATAID